jgi:hypothetical protein
VLVLDGGRESFASRVAWITEGKKSNTALPDVVAVAAFLFGSAGEPGLLGKARAQLAEHDAAREQERAALAAAGFEGGLLIEFPRLLRFARRFAEEADQQFVDAQLERWTADLEASLALDGGRLLDLARLSALPSLQDRIDWVGTRPALAAQPPRGRLQRLEAARLLHVEGAVERARSLALAAGLGSAESGGPGWVELLELHLSLLRTGGPLPLGGSQKSYFRVQHSPTATTIEEWSPKADGAGRTAVNAFDLSRRVGSDRVLQLQGRVLYLDNDALVELGQLGAGQRVERWKPPTQGGDLSLLPAAAQDRLRALQEGPGARCLVIERASGREVWLSPELGIVKMPAAGGILYELLSALL